MNRSQKTGLYRQVLAQAFTSSVKLSPMDLALSQLIGYSGAETEAQSDLEAVAGQGSATELNSSIPLIKVPSLFLRSRYLWVPGAITPSGLLVPATVKL